MAGINDGDFCSQLAAYGFDMVTLGGYNLDQPTIDAGKKIKKRGRPEFDIEIENIISHIEKQAEIIRAAYANEILISVNLRAITTEPMVEVSKLKKVDVVEINAHCRQPEIMDLNCGQAMLLHPKRLFNFTKELVKKSQSKVSVKIRTNVPGVDDILISKVIENAGADYLHVDAMKPGYDQADYLKISQIRKNCSIFIIGNNSIRNVESAEKMYAAGADGISIARAAMSGKLSFDLSLI